MSTPGRSQANPGALCAEGSPVNANLDTAPERHTFTYEAITPLGSLALDLPPAGTPPGGASAALAAVRLAAAEASLQRLEAWLEPVAGPLDWRWCRPAEAQRVQVGLEDDATLELPWPLLRQAGAPQALELRWPEVDAWCLFDRFHLDDAEAALLELGGVVVLAASDPWVEADDGIAVSWATPGAPPEGDWSVQCRTRCPLPQALGWAAGDPRRGLDGVARNAVQLRHHGVVRALGELIPWGRSQALRLTAWT